MKKTKKFDIKKTAKLIKDIENTYMSKPIKVNDRLSMRFVRNLQAKTEVVALKHIMFSDEIYFKVETLKKVMKILNKELTK